MTLSFNLIERPFIPCLRDGRVIEYSLRDVLLNAHEITELRDGSPLVTVALHRLLLAILHRCYEGPRKSADRVAIRKTGRFGPECITAYFDKWADRFDLFHERYPFYQMAGYAQDEPSSANRLVKELSRGNNAMLFDHTSNDPPMALTPGQAARALISEQMFAYSAGRGRKGEPHTLDAPIGRGAAVFALGDNLFETLWLNLTIYDGGEKPVACGEEDGPIWEQAPIRPYEDSQTPRGYLDYLTWQSRTICLHPETDAERIIIRNVSYSQGRVWNQISGFYDPFAAYERVPDIGDRAVQFREDRDLWRDSAALFQFGEADQFRGPTCLHTLGSLVADGYLSESDRYRVLVAGAKVESGQPNLVFWRHETLPLPLAYLDQPAVVESLKTSLKMAEDVERVALWPAARATAENWMTTQAMSETGKKPDGDRVRKMAKSFATMRLYWSRLEHPFRQLVVELANPETDRFHCVSHWYWEILYVSANQAFEESIYRIDGGRDLKAVNAGRMLLFSRLKQIRHDHHIPIHEKEGAV